MDIEKEIRDYMERANAHTLAVGALPPTHGPIPPTRSARAVGDPTMTPDEEAELRRTLGERNYAAWKSGTLPTREIPQDLEPSHPIPQCKVRGPSADHYDFGHLPLTELLAVREILNRAIYDKERNR